MKVHLKTLAVVGLISLLHSAYAQNNAGAAPVTIASPNGEITMLVSATGGVLQYAVNYKNMPVIEASGLGLVVNGKVLGITSTIGKVQRYKTNETYAYRGVHSTAINKCNGAKIIVGSANAPFVVEARVYNDGVAFRYIVGNTGDAVID